MSMDKVFGIAGSALAAQLVRMNTTASNLANAANTSDTAEGAYKAKRVVFRTLLADQSMGEQTRYAGSIHIGNVAEMVEMTAAARSYRNNIEVVNTAKQMMMRTLEVMKS